MKHLSLIFSSLLIFGSLVACSSEPTPKEDNQPKESAEQANDKSSTNFTPEQALKSLENTKYEVVEVIDTKFFEGNNVAYTIFYSEFDNRKNYITVAKFDKTQSGWEFDEMSGVGIVDVENTEDYTPNNDSFNIGFATSNIAKVQVGKHEAELIPLKGTEMKVWLFNGLSAKEFNNNDLNFLDNKKKLIKAY